MTLSFDVSFCQDFLGIESGTSLKETWSWTAMPKREKFSEGLKNAQLSSSSRKLKDFKVNGAKW